MFIDSYFDVNTKACFLAFVDNALVREESVDPICCIKGHSGPLFVPSFSCAGRCVALVSMRTVACRRQDDSHDQGQTGSKHRRGPVRAAQHKTENHFWATGD